MTFSEIYFAKTGVHPADFESVVLRRSLKPAARLFRALLALRPNYFATDREFVREVGRISRRSDFDECSYGFAHHPDGRGSFIARWDCVSPENGSAGWCMSICHDDENMATGYCVKQPRSDFPDGAGSIHEIAGGNL